MALLHLLAYAGGLAAFLFVTLSLASGLLWLAELIEEHSKHAKYVGIRAIYVIITLHVLLYFTDSLPILPVLFSIVCHIVYLQNFSTSWPYISLTSPKFILSCILVVADHFTWFFHFAHLAQEAKKFRGPKYRYGQNRIAQSDGSPAFGDVAAFFAICVWFVPLFLFLSLSANDNALPSFESLASGPASPSRNSVDLSSPGPGSSSPTHRQIRARSSTSLVKSVLNPLLSVLPRVRSRGRKNDEGIIAPRTPIRGSPIHSPVMMPSNQGYFPWGSDESSSSGNTLGTPTNLNLNLPSSSSSSSTTTASPDGNKLRSKTPPPPRRVQSEIQISKGFVNPRGIATRNGRPALNQNDLGENTEILERPKKSSPLGQSSVSSPSMNLGPQDHILSNLHRRKAD
ncbi:uncharacterized protein IL334_000154 [Kwoniella shivajii]|uniref:Endoplasmic reticulum protein n=1 Tax=Kwoniella shivajii TaxID=564305 RepID=A0ABZ1CNC3_9TREE|nr:hypothetical protein IL334_000154 [Kwoniella shivajii]